MIRLPGEGFWGAYKLFIDLCRYIEMLIIFVVSLWEQGWHERGMRKGRGIVSRLRVVERVMGLRNG